MAKETKYETEKIIRDSNLQQAVASVTRNPKLDQSVKRLLSDKQVLARILKRVTVEFMDEDLDSIMDCIEGKPQIETVPITPGFSNLPPEATQIMGDNTESAIPEEGTHYFDIRFSARIPNNKYIDFGIRIIVDIEAQNDFYLSYDIVSRGIFYGARLLSSQSGTEFIGDDYRNLRKVYSIWICTDPPKYATNSIVSFRVKPEVLYGNIPLPKIKAMKYDLMDVVLVFISSEKSAEKDELCGMLEVLLDKTLDAEHKLQKLSHEYGMKRTYTLTKEVARMGDYSLGIAKENFIKGYEEGREDGHAKGREEGRDSDQIVIAKNLLLQNMTDDFILNTGILPENLAKAKEALASTKE